MSHLLQDLRYHLRAMLRNPGFFAVAILTLAIAIGAITAIFSILNALLLRPYPYPEPEELVVVRAMNPQLDVDNASVSFVDFTDFRQGSEAFDDLAAIRTREMNLGGVDEPTRVRAAEVTAGLFGLLGGQPVMGRTFRPEEDRPGATPVVVLSRSLWERMFNADPDILGTTIDLDGTQHEVIGVVPPEAQFPDTDMAELFVPAARDPAQLPRESREELVIGRLAPGISAQEGEAELAGIAARLARDHETSNEGWGVSVRTLREFRTQRFSTLSLILFGVVGLVLLIACLNVSNLLLQRATHREREIAIRSAIGAQRSRVLAQLLTESVVLALAGGVLGLLLAYWGLRALVRAIPQQLPSYMNDFGIDLRVLLFLLAIALVTAVVFGLAPSLKLSRPDLRQSLSDSGARSGTGGSNKARSSLVVVEIALSVILLIGAGLMIRSFLKMQSVDPGFEPRNALALEITLPENRFADAVQKTQFLDRAVERLASLPGVESVGAVSDLPLDDGAYIAFGLEGQSDDQAQANPLVAFRSVRGDHLEAAGVPLLEGRRFDNRDLGEPRSAMVSSNLARRLWPDERAVGRRIKLLVSGEQYWVDVVGVVGNLAPLRPGDDDERFQVIVPYPFLEGLAFSDLALVLRTAGDPLDVAPSVRKEMQALAPGLPVEIKSLQEAVDETLWFQRITSMLFTVFAGIALVLAVVGLYGAMSYSFAQRTREIGIRMVLGAEPGDVLRMVVRQGGVLIAIAVAIGLAGALGAGRLLGRMLYEVRGTDPVTFIAVILLVVLVALAAVWVPARRATRVQPVTALRNE